MVLVRKTLNQAPVPLYTDCQLFRLPTGKTKNFALLDAVYLQFALVNFIIKYVMKCFDRKICANVKIS